MGLSDGQRRSIETSKKLLSQGASEIKVLRKDNNHMGEKLWLVEKLLELKFPHSGGGVSADIAYEMDEHSRKLNPNE